MLRVWLLTVNHFFRSNHNAAFSVGIVLLTFMANCVAVPRAYHWTRSRDSRISVTEFFCGRAFPSMSVDMSVGPPTFVTFPDSS